MKTYSRAVKIWLVAGIVLLFFQVIIGGVTRITGSGLSITKWEIVTGTLPPMNEEVWLQEFELYKATPQYEKINQGMSLSEFKFIYFWEYLHRVWARGIGLIFAIPFFIFLAKGYIDRTLRNRLFIVVILAAITASFGWIMVASGLVDRPWVNAYKLSLHLSLALLTLGYLVWITLDIFWGDRKLKIDHRFSGLIKWFFVLLCIQLFLGGMMSGMRAALLYPTWPDMNGELIASELFIGDNWHWEHFVNYDRGIFMGALVQFLHRTLAYALFIYGIFIFYRMFKSRTDILKRSSVIFIILLCSQVLIGILTVINSKGTIPVFYGVLHQAIAILLLMISIVLLYLNSRKEIFNK